jgi:hypothetical protein
LHGWQEAERPNGMIGLAQPASDAPAVRWQLVANRGGVSRDCPPVRPAVGDDHPNADAGRIPASRGGDLRCEAALAIERAEELVQINQLGLELDDEERSGLRMPGKDIDRSSLAPDRERDLGLDDSARPSGEEPRQDLVHRGVPGIDQAPEVAALPSHGHVDPGVKCHGHPPYLCDRHAGDPAALDPHHDPARHAGPDREVVLPPVSPRPDRAKGPPYSLVVHRASMVEPAHPMITGGGCG